MYAAAIAFSGATTAVTLGLPHFQLGSLDIGIPIQAFGVIVAAGVLIGASLLRRYAEWHGVSDDHIRGLLGWITITGFLGAHWFDVLAYEPQKLSEAINWGSPSKWPVLLRIWDGISSYGGFLGGAMGFAFYVWWKRLPVRLMADVAIVGLLPAFSIGRIGCTVVSDHIGAVVDKANWYAALAMDYPRPHGLKQADGTFAPFSCPWDDARLPPIEKAHCEHLPTSAADTTITMWNLGLIELLYLIPVNLIVLKLAFRSSKRMPAGYLTVLTGVLYAPVRFFLDYLRPESTDPRYLGMTFAQWASLLAFGVSLYAASRILKGGKPADVVAPTSREAQERLRLVLKEDEEKEKESKAEKAKPAKKTEEPAKKRPPSEPEDDDEDEKPVAKKPAAAKDAKPAAAKDVVKGKAEDKKPEAKAEDKKPEAKAEDKKPEDKKPEAKAEDKKPEAKAEDKEPEAKAEDKKPEAKAEDKPTATAEAKAEDKPAEAKAEAKPSDDTAEKK